MGVRFQGWPTTSGALSVRVWLVFLLLIHAGCAEPGSTPPSASEAFKRGTEHFDGGDLDGAIGDFTEAIRQDPSLAHAYNNRGLAKATKGDLDAAIADYDACLALPPPIAEACYNRAVARLQKGDPAEAIVDFTRAVALNPAYARAYAGRGLVRIQTGDTTGAILDYKRALEIAPPGWSERKSVEAELEKATRSQAGK